MINWERVDELRSEVGPEDFAEVVDLFLEEVDEAIGGLATVGAGELAASLHFIKGSALNLGFRALADACLANERHLAAGLGGMVDLTSLDAVYAQSKEVFLNGRHLRLAG